MSRARENILERGQNGKDFLMRIRCDLCDLETLSDYVLVGYHDLLLVRPLFTLKL
jgi:hypothetical protein